MQSITGLHELVPAVHSPFHADGSLAADVVPTQAAFLAANGVRTVFVTGSTGECHSLTCAERQALYEAWAHAGPTQGIVFYGDRKMPVGTDFNLTGGGTQNFGGAIYLPKAKLKFSGGNGTTTSCTKIIADTIAFSGASNLKVDCAALGTATIGSTTALLVE